MVDEVGNPLGKNKTNYNGARLISNNLPKRDFLPFTLINVYQGKKALKSGTWKLLIFI